MSLKIGFQGPEVEYLQSTLYKLGMYRGYPNGKYDLETEKSIRRFQNKNNLQETGQLDKITRGLIIRYMRGYTEHIVRPKDNLYAISNKYHTTPIKIINANPYMNPFILEDKEKLTIPFQYLCVYEDISYTYEVLENNINGLKKRYPFLEVSVIGRSIENRNIYALKVGKGKRKLFVNGGTHACEWITVPILMKWIEELCHLYTCKGLAYGRCIEEILNKTSIYIVPMVNPDGIELSIKGVAVKDPRYKQLTLYNNNSDDFRKWKANIRGIDLNRNYNAKWNEYKKVEKQMGIKGPWFELYGGEYPESEPETKAIVNYTKQEKFDMVLAYHTQGQVIYWDFQGLSSDRSKEMAKKLARASRYCLDIPAPNATYAGYKDWFIQEFRKPGYTIECGLGENPLPITQFDKIYSDNFELLFTSAWGE